MSKTNYSTKTVVSKTPAGKGPIGLASANAVKSFVANYDPQAKLFAEIIHAQKWGTGRVLLALVNNALASDRAYDGSRGDAPVLVVPVDVVGQVMNVTWHWVGSPNWTRQSQELDCNVRWELARLIYLQSKFGANGPEPLWDWRGNAALFTPKFKALDIPKWNAGTPVVDPADCDPFKSDLAIFRALTWGMPLHSPEMGEVEGFLNHLETAKWQSSPKNSSLI